MSLFSPLIQAWTWFKSHVIDHTKDAAKIAVVITETVKAILNNPITGFLLNIADGVAHSQLPTEIATAVNNEIPKIISVELAIEGLPDNPTQDQIISWEQDVLKSFGVTSDKSKLYTVLAAQVYVIIKSKLTDGVLTFAEGVQSVEEAWQAYQSDLANPGIIDLPVGTVLPNGNQIVETAADALAEQQNPQISVNENG